MKKILIYNGQLFMGGIERVLTTFLRELSENKDIQVELLIKENNPGKNVFQDEVPENIKLTYIKTEEMVRKREEYSAKKKKSLYNRIKYALAIKNERIYMKKWLKDYFEARKDIDVVIDFDMSLGKYLDVIDRPKIGWVHYTLEARKGKKRERFDKRLGKYDRVIVICDEMKEEMKRIHRSSYEKTHRIYNPFVIRELKEKSEDLRGLSLDEKELLKEDYIVGVSRLVKGKARDELIKAFKIAKDRGLKEKLYILGEGREKENLEKLIQDLDLEGSVYLLGQKSNPYPWMKNASLFAHTSYGEGLPTVFIESMICGTPVVAYDCPTGPKEILGDGRYGALVEMGDIEGAAEKIYSILTDQEIKNKYKESLEDRVKEFSAENSVSSLMNIIDEL